MKCHLSVVATLALLLAALAVGPAAADEVINRLKAQAEELQNQAKELDRLGRKVEAQKVQNDANALLKEVAAREAAAIAAERPRRVGTVLERQVTELRARYFDLRNRGQVDQAEQVRQEMNRLIDQAAEKRQSEAAAMRLQAERFRADGADDPRTKKIEQMIDDQQREIARLRTMLDREPTPMELGDVGLTRRQRRTHLLEAAAHLRAAGRAELADDLTAEAAELARAEAIETPRPAEAPMPAETDLRKEVEALRREVQELRARLNPPVNPR